MIYNDDNDEWWWWYMIYMNEMMNIYDIMNDDEWNDEYMNRNDIMMNIIYDIYDIYNDIMNDEWDNMNKDEINEI